MPRSDFQSKPIFNLGGPTRNAIAAQNVRYSYAEENSVTVPQCKVRNAQRAGHGVAFNPASAVQSMFNFIATDPVLNTPVNEVLFYDGTQVKAYNVLTNAIAALSPPITVSALKLSVAEAGTRAYVASFNENGTPAGPGYLVDTSNVTEKLFEPPILTTNITITPSETLAGSVTAGVHRIALVLTTGGGYTTRPGPVDSFNVFQPVSFTSSGGQNIHLAITGTWAAAVVGISILMSPVTDPGTYYFVANATAAIAGRKYFLGQHRYRCGRYVAHQFATGARLFPSVLARPSESGGPVQS